MLMLLTSTWYLHRISGDAAFLSQEAIFRFNDARVSNEFDDLVVKTLADVQEDVVIFSPFYLLFLILYILLLFHLKLNIVFYRMVLTGFVVELKMLSVTMDNGHTWHVNNVSKRLWSLRMGSPVINAIILMGLSFRGLVFPTAYHHLYLFPHLTRLLAFVLQVPVHCERCWR